MSFVGDWFSDFGLWSQGLFAVRVLPCGCLGLGLGGCWCCVVVVSW